MSFWTFLFLAIVVWAIQAAYEKRMSYRAQAGQGQFDEQLAKLERRIENLETIIIERDRKSEYDRL